MKNKYRIFTAFLLAASILLSSCNFEKQPNSNTEGVEVTTEPTLTEAPVVTFDETTPQILPETTPDATPEETTPAPEVTTPAPEVTTPVQETTTSAPEGTTPAINEDEAYLNIPIQKARGYMSKTYGIKDSSIAFKMKFYLDWEHRASGGGDYRILSNGIEIGRVVSGEADDVSEWKTILQKNATPKQFQVIEYLEKSGTGDTLRFRHRFCYHYIECGKERLLTVIIAYGEIDDYVQTQLRESATYQEHRTDPMYGTLSHLQDKPIIVLGNSFIGTSIINYIYNDIAKSSGKSPLMYAQSRGYASIQTYAQDSALLKRIANGEWSAVFLCGFYGRDTTSVGIIKDACDKSNTQLIIFPAHNESDAMRGIATSDYPELLCINWKREIDQLIKEGRSKWDFCINDEHLHSTPLAGYVGAMMIWRAIWGEMPKVTLTSGYIDQAWADSVLGSYLNSPTFKLMDSTNIYFVE